MAALAIVIALVAIGLTFYLIKIVRDEARRSEERERVRMRAVLAEVRDLEDRIAQSEWAPWPKKGDL